MGAAVLTGGLVLAVTGRVLGIIELFAVATAIPMRVMTAIATPLPPRMVRACRAMAERGLDGLLIFRQESMYYLTGYDTSGYSMFQGMYLGADGKFALCTRSADLRRYLPPALADTVPPFLDMHRRDVDRGDVGRAIERAIGFLRRLDRRHRDADVIEDGLHGLDGTP